MPAPSRFRRKLFIDSAVQGALLRRLFFHWLYAILMAFVCLIMVQICTHGVELSFSDHIQLIWTRYGILFAVMGMLFPIFAYDTMKLSHRFAGPIYAIRFALRRLASGGDIPRVTFRKHDYWTELGDDLNIVAERLGLLRDAQQTVPAATQTAATEQIAQAPTSQESGVQAVGAQASTDTKPPQSTATATSGTESQPTPAAALPVVDLTGAGDPQTANTVEPLS